MDDQLDFLKLKPQPKQKSDYFFNLNKESGLDDKKQVPNIIDKTEEEFDIHSFMKTLKSKLQVTDYEEDLSYMKNYDETKKELHSDYKINDFITQVVKTGKKIKINNLKTKNKTKDGKPTTNTGKIIPDLDTDDRKTGAPEIGKTKKHVYNQYDEEMDELLIGDTNIKDRIKEPLPNILVKANEYYLYNRENYIKFMENLFISYKQELLQQEADMKAGKILLDCNGTKERDFSLLMHQKIVRDYINLYTPYRGILLYHGLGSGKTCSSIAIAEGFKNNKKVMIMLPASLKANYIDELKNCGDYLYKKNQYWEFVSILSNPEYLKPLTAVLGLSEEQIKKNKGAWLINSKKSPNYNSSDLTDKDREAINEQINTMILNKYEFVSYNGLRANGKMWRSLTNNNTINPFSNKTIIIDEAHNIISRIINKIKSPGALFNKIYELLMSAENCKIIMLSGTPIINYPNEIAILFNILRGYIRTYNFKLIIDKKTYTEKYLQDVLYKSIIGKHIDYISYDSVNKILQVYKNPFNFVNDIEGSSALKYDENNMSNDEFFDLLLNILKEKSIKYSNIDSIIQNYKALEDKFDEFKSTFINESNNIKNGNMLIRRIMGLTSYFESAQKQLMPKYDDTITLVEIEMNKPQFDIYNKARIQERKLEENSKKKKSQKKIAGNDQIYDSGISTYRIFSRAFCNFVFPDEIKRPMPKKTSDNIETAINELTENDDQDIIDIKTEQDLINDPDGIKDDEEDLKNISESNDYETRIKNSYLELERNSGKYLNKDSLANNCSPKFLNILENIKDPSYKGIHLLYSQFKTLEGIGIFKLVLLENGFVEFKIKKNSKGEYILDVKEEDMGKPMFAGYTGSEKPEEREIIKNVLNNNWDFVPSEIVKQITRKSSTNLYGEIIKLIMITASGAEGISLKNVRYVHLMEPYWHPVRLRQVIGRANRICSHNELPELERTVDVFLYLMIFNKEMIEDEKELNKRDKILDVNNGIERVATTDEYLYNLCLKKEKITKDILFYVKKSAFDCSLHGNNKDCYNIGNPNPDKLMYTPNPEKQNIDEQQNINITKENVNIQIITYANKKYGYETIINEELKNKGYIALAYAASDIDPNLVNSKIKVGVFSLLENGKKILTPIKDLPLDILTKLNELYQ
jgi:hypothetical protein